MTQQWIRNASIVIAGSNGQGLEVGDLRCVFRVEHATTETPKNMALRVFNVSESTIQAAKAAAKEEGLVSLSVGYGYPNVAPPPRLGLLFKGNIKQVRSGRASATDTYLDVFAASADNAYNYGVIRKTLAAGYTQEDVANEVQRVFQEFGVTQGYRSTFKQQQAPRGKVMWGMARDYARDMAYTNAMSWNMGDGELQFVGDAEVIPGEAIVLNALTGLIGMPEQTQDGITFRALLNPRIRSNAMIRIDNKSVQQAAIPLSYTGSATIFPNISTDGNYKVVFADYVGDTHGNDWYCQGVCLALDNTAPPSAAVVNAVEFQP